MPACSRCTSMPESTSGAPSALASSTVVLQPSKNDGLTSAWQSEVRPDHVLVRQHAEESELVLDAELGGTRARGLPVMTDVPHVVRVAGCRDHDARLPLLELRQRLDHDRVVLVLPELVGQIEKALRQSVFLEQRADPERPRAAAAGRRSARRPSGHGSTDRSAPSPRAHPRCSASGCARRSPARGSRSRAATTAARENICGRWRCWKSGVQASVGDREAPAVELRGLEDHVDARVAEYARGGRHVAERARAGEPDAREAAVEDRRT